jgi:hypothetical protein
MARWLEPEAVDHQRQQQLRVEVEHLAPQRVLRQPLDEQHARTHQRSRAVGRSATSSRQPLHEARAARW